MAGFKLPHDYFPTFEQEASDGTERNLQFLWESTKDAFVLLFNDFQLIDASTNSCSDRMAGYVVESQLLLQESQSKVRTGDYRSWTNRIQFLNHLLVEHSASKSVLAKYVAICDTLKASNSSNVFTTASLNILQDPKLGEFKTQVCQMVNSVVDTCLLLYNSCSHAQEWLNSAVFVKSTWSQHSPPSDSVGVLSGFACFAQELQCPWDPSEAGKQPSSRKLHSSRSTRSHANKRTQRRSIESISRTMQSGDESELVKCIREDIFYWILCRSILMPGPVTGSTVDVNWLYDGISFAPRNTEKAKKATIFVDNRILVYYLCATLRASLTEQIRCLKLITMRLIFSRETASDFLAFPGSLGVLCALFGASGVEAEERKNQVKVDDELSRSKFQLMIVILNHLSIAATKDMLKTDFMSAPLKERYNAYTTIQYYVFSYNAALFGDVFAWKVQGCLVRAAVCNSISSVSAWHHTLYCKEREQFKMIACAANQFAINMHRRRIKMLQLLQGTMKETGDRSKCPDTQLPPSPPEEEEVKAEEGGIEAEVSENHSTPGHNKRNTTRTSHSSSASASDILQNLSFNEVNAKTWKLVGYKGHTEENRLDDLTSDDGYESCHVIDDWQAELNSLGSKTKPDPVAQQQFHLPTWDGRHPWHLGKPSVSSEWVPEVLSGAEFHFQESLRIANSPGALEHSPFAPESLSKTVQQRRVSFSVVDSLLSGFRRRVFFKSTREKRDPKGKDSSKILHSRIRARSEQTLSTRACDSTSSDLEFLMQGCLFVFNCCKVTGELNRDIRVAREEGTSKEEIKRVIEESNICAIVQRVRHTVTSDSLTIPSPGALNPLKNIESVMVRFKQPMWCKDPHSKGSHRSPLGKSITMSVGKVPIRKSMKIYDQ